MTDATPTANPAANPLAGSLAVFRREWSAYFASPLAVMFLVIFLALAGVCTFYPGQFFERGIADLQPFFRFHPWLYMLLAPALSMRSWAEERKLGTFELLLTLPLHPLAAIWGKFLASWAFAGLGLALTFPIWITVTLLGTPDQGAIVAGYFGSLFMAGGYLAIGACLSAATRSQIVAFLGSLGVGFLVTMAGMAPVLDFLRGWAPADLIEAVTAFSMVSHFNALSQGVIGAADLIYFIGMIVAWLAAALVLVDLARDAG